MMQLRLAAFLNVQPDCGGYANMDIACLGFVILTAGISRSVPMPFLHFLGRKQPASLIG